MRQVRRTTGGIGRTLARANKIVGFGLSVGLLAVASLIVIPSMIAAGGDLAWGAIAVGQSIGAIAAVVIYFGWGHAGPALIARADEGGRRTAFIESLKSRSVLAVPAAGVAAGTAALVAPGSPQLAAVAALFASSVGLTSDWYFVGTARPYRFLLMETAPRVAGSGVAIVLMRSGSSPLIGLLAMLGGMLLAVIVVTMSVLIATVPVRHGSEPRGILDVLRSQRAGMASSVGSAIYIATPIIIVSLMAPAVQPVFALADKVQRQISTALNPLVSVAQGWVPRAAPGALGGRAKTALLATGAAALGLGIVVLLGAPLLFSWMGGGQISVTTTITVLVAAFVGVNFYESVVARAVLATYQRLSAVAKLTALGAAVGLPCVAFGAVLWGAPGALAGVGLGLLIRLGGELVIAVRQIRTGRDVRFPNEGAAVRGAVNEN